MVAVSACSAISFFPAKLLGCYGDHGVVLTDDESMAQVLDSLRAHGAGTDKHDNQRIGLNGRLNVMQVKLVRSRISSPDRATAEIGFVAEKDLEEGLQELTEWRGSHMAEIEARR